MDTAQYKQQKSYDKNDNNHQQTMQTINYSGKNNRMITRTPYVIRGHAVVTNKSITKGKHKQVLTNHVGIYIYIYI